MLGRVFDQNFRTRVLTAIVAAPIALGLIIYSWQTTAVLLIILLALATYEYIKLVQSGPSNLLNDVIFGTTYLLIPLIGVIWLRRWEPDGLAFFILVLVTIWVTDSAALIGGKLYGKRKFAPVVSPKKTWEGVYTGALSGVVACLVFALILGLGLTTATILLALVIPPASIYGDLIESKLKRRFGVKDSGNLFPGHGGVLDRIDSPLLCLPIAAVIVALFAGG